MLSARNRESSNQETGPRRFGPKTEALEARQSNPVWNQIAVRIQPRLNASGAPCPKCEDEREKDQAGPADQTLWQSLATRVPAVQAKLEVSSPGDTYEQEADRIADQVMRMAPPSGGHELSFTAETSLAPRRKLDEQSGTVEPPSTALPLVQQTLRSPGRPLDTATRGFMEPRFGYDLSQLRVHDDAPALASAHALHAAAYTLGSDIVFGAGMYRPQSNDGRRLLAHELAHVLQQGRTGDRIQRQTDDFRVTQLQPDPQERTQGMPDRFFFELNRSDLRADVPAEAAERARLETWATARAGQHVRLVGRASQEGAAARNMELARQRAATVRGVLVARGVLVDSVQIDMTFAQRPVDYRFYRSVEVIGAGSTGVTCTTFTTAQQNQDVLDCKTAFTAALGRAVAIANAAMARLRPAADPAATPAPDRDTVLNDRFPGIPRATVLPLFESVVTRLGEVGLAANHVCNHRCAAGCERPASAAPGGPLNLCPGFYIAGFQGRTISPDERVFVVMHETTHSAVVPGSTPPESVGIDFAYANTRLFGALQGSETLHNTDSYVMTLLVLARNTSGAPAVTAARGVGPADTYSLITPAGEPGDRNRTARRAIGFAESWLNYASFWSPNMYDFVAQSLVAWDASQIGRLGHGMLEMFAPLFQLNHPGTAQLSSTDRPKIVTFQTAVAARGFPTPAATSRAAVQDRTRIAGIYDRLTRMHDRLRSPLVVDWAASGDGSWSAGSGLPGLGTNVQLADAFFTSTTPVGQARHVIRLMARAMSDVGATWVEAHVEAADGVHQFRGLGP